jgi:hypothetical protein
VKRTWLSVSFMLFAVLLLSVACSKPIPADVELKYDNNSLKEYLPVSSPSFTGYVVSFTAPSGKLIVNTIRINGMVAAWGKYEDKAIELQLWDKDREVIYQDSYPDVKLPVNPYDSKTPFKPETTWTDISVPDVAVMDNFYVHIHSDDGRWGEFRMGADDSVTNSHSDLTVRDGSVDKILEAWPYWKTDSTGKVLWYGDKSKVNWMIRVVGQDSTK